MAEKEKKEKKEVAQRSRYGHRQGSMGAVIDDMVWAGVDLQDAVKELVRSSGRDDSHAKTKFLGHVKHLQKNKGITVTVKGEHYKSKEARIKEA